MCFDGGITAALITGAVSALTTGVSTAFSVAQANQQQKQAYNERLRQQQLTNQAVQSQFNEKVARENLDARRQARSNFDQAQTSIRENQRRQASAVAGASSAGLTGTPLNLLNNEFQSAIGGISANLQDTFRQLNENRFLNLESARREGQSALNSAVPAAPNFQKWSPLPALVAGVGTTVGNLRFAKPVETSINYQQFGGPAGGYA